ncbi:MAG: hypothetical protein KDA55_22210, partial [Planctomycetales bacterium]|nr:hypothetical protein [Planctomycetales bacterium]
LARRLGMRRPVTVLVSSGRTGPAVIGLWRPRIVMPAVLVDDRQIAQLEPLLAHELLHVRRGDLWLSVLQAVARTVWWFHPLVWMAMSRITREAERCCDEAVLAELGCEPAHYARSLLDVLERKRLFQAVPLFPGVRPVDITTSRLERIMSLRHGCRRRSPWWCWGVLIGLAAVVLPGAGHLVDATEPASRSYQSVQSPKKRVAPSEWQLVDVPELNASGKQQQEPAQTYVKAYALRDLLDEFGKADGTDEATSKKALMEWLKQSVAKPDSPQNDGAKLFGRGIDSDAGVVGELMVDDEKFTWYEDQLIVRLDQSGHERLANEIAQRQEYGFKEIAIRTWIISGDARTIRKLFDEWEVGEVLKSPTATVSPDTVGNRDNTLGPTSSVASRITVKTEKHYPSQVASLNEKQSQQLLRRVQADRRGNVMQAPKVTLLNGQRASIQDVSFRPFVVGFRKTVPANSDAGSNASTPSADAVLARRLPPGFEPEIQVISEGTTLRLAPTLRDNDRVTIEFDIRLASIRGVETTQFKLGSENKPVKVQTPVVSSMQVASTVTCRMGESIAVGGLEMVDAEG